MALFDNEYTNIFADGEVAGRSPDAEGDYYHITDAQQDHDYMQDKFYDLVSSISDDPTEEYQILFGGVVTDGGGGTVDISECVAKGKDSSGKKRLIHLPALTGVALPSGWNNNRQIWVILKYDFKLGSSTRTHRAGVSYHYQLNDTYLGDEDSYSTTSTDDLFVDADPTGSAVVLGSFKMNGTTFTDYGVLGDRNKVKITPLDWIPAEETWTYASADSPTFTLTTAGDKRTKYSKGMKFKLEQDQVLSAYWTFNSSSAADVGTFTMADIGTPTYTSGKFGNALTLDGSTDALSITDTATLKPTGDFTFGCWVKTSNTGAAKIIFSSRNTTGGKAYGFSIVIESTNVIGLFMSKGTGLTLNTDFNILTGATTVTDGNWHYVVVTVKNNWAQIYVDGKLDGSGYVFSVVYNATNYVQIGRFYDGSSSLYWFNGQIDDLFFINGYALDEETIKAKYDAGTAQGTSDITVTKKFILTDISYSASNTTLTLYGGTDFALANATISNPYYSIVAQPYGFNRNPDKWSVIFTDSTLRIISASTGSFVTSGISITKPIGDFIFYCSIGFQTGGDESRAVFGYTNNSEDLPEYSMYTTGSSGSSMSKNNKFNSTDKKTVYLNIASSTGTTCYIKGDSSMTILKFINANI